MKIKITLPFRKFCKKLPKNYIVDVEEAIDKIITCPTVGELKKGDLAHVRVYKFKINKQLILLAYTYDESTLVLLNIGSHENFYRDLH